MLHKDRTSFLRYVQERQPVVITARDCPDLSAVEPATEEQLDSGKTMILWNRNLLPSLRRKLIAESGYYRVDEFRYPVLEFTAPCRLATWEGKPALIQQRLYGVFDGKPNSFERWYDSLVRWIRKNFVRVPNSSFGGYVGPEAYKFYCDGGYLLPNILPPRTKQWLEEIGRQHKES